VCVDVLAEQDGRVHEMTVPRSVGADRHGTGCTLASAIASLLATGSDVATACEQAQAYVGAAIGTESSPPLGRGSRPLFHLPHAPLIAGPSA
jgi:hydroxymethylpyrimidine/phosphomethylpyrimidine kinase